MPFTPSHAVVALPFARTRLVPAAVAVGAMTPDLPIFLRGMVPDYGMTHDVAWLPVTMAVAFGLLLMWRCVLRPAARELSPRPLAVRLPSSWDAGAWESAKQTVGGGVRGVLWLVLALALGVLSHILWDLFTHEGRTGEQLFPVLAEQWGPLPGVKWMQHGSSVLGLLVIGLWGALWLVRRPVAPVTAVLPQGVRIAWMIALPLGLVIAAVAGVLVWGPFDADFTPTHLVYAVLPQTCAAWGVATTAIALWVQRRRRTSLPQNDAEPGVRHARDAA